MAPSRAARVGVGLALGALAALAEHCTGAPGARSAVAGVGVGPDGGIDSGAARPDADGPGAAQGHADAGSLGLVFLGQIEVVNHLEPLPGNDDPIRITLEATKAAPRAFDEIARRTGANAPPTGGLTFEARGYPVSSDAVAAGHRSATFVLDYDEPSVRQARADAVRVCGSAPSMDQLSRFVDRFIARKDMARGFDIASQVARRKEGDCTEHAVLLAALARSFGIPARIALGLVIVPVEGKLFAFGHAWVEYHEGGAWHPADAAVPPEAKPRYVPLQVLRDEGPAFLRGMGEATGAFLVVRRVLLDPPSRSR